MLKVFKVKQIKFDIARNGLIWVKWMCIQYYLLDLLYMFIKVKNIFKK